MKPILHICKIDIFNSPFKYSTAFHTLPYHHSSHSYPYIYYIICFFKNTNISRIMDFYPRFSIKNWPTSPPLPSSIHPRLRNIISKKFINLMQSFSFLMIKSICIVNVHISFKQALTLRYLLYLDIDFEEVSWCLSETWPNFDHFLSEWSQTIWWADIRTLVLDFYAFFNL